MKSIPLDKIQPNPEQPRKTFDEESLANLAQSIRENGLLQPVIVEQAGEGQYLLRDGERRWRACKLAGLKKIPAVIVQPGEGELSHARLIQALVANLQREDLNPIEEARAYYRLVEELGLSRSSISRKVGVGETRITWRLQLLELDVPIQELVAEGKLPRSPRVVSALMSIPEQEARIKLAGRLAYEGVTLATIESACRKLKGQLGVTTKKDPNKPPAVAYAADPKGRSRNTQIWEQLQERGKLPSWELVLASAEKSCRDCALFEVASAKTCSECPAVFLVANLVAAASEENS